MTCLEGDGCEVSFEPEGAVIPLRVGERLHVEITGEDNDALEISYLPDGIVVGAYWNGASTRVFDGEGHQLDPVQRRQRDDRSGLSRVIGEYSPGPMVSRRIRLTEASCGAGRSS